MTISNLRTSNGSLSLLPFLKAASSSGLSIKNRTPDEPADESSSDSAGLEVCAQDLINAIHSKDTKRVASAIKAAFDIASSMPEEEEEESDEKLPIPDNNSFKSQNAKAAAESE